jgi:hypothetical protein
MPLKIMNGADLNNQRMVNLGDPSSATDGVNLQTLQAFVRGLSWKDDVRAASTGNINLASPGASIDGVSMSASDRFLAKNQTAPAENGIYVWTGAASAATRAVDADTAAEIAGATVTVTEGTTSGGAVYHLAYSGAITLGTTGLTPWNTIGGGSSYTEGNGIDITGSVISIQLDTDSGLIVAAGGIKVDYSTIARRVAANIGNGSLTALTFTHNLGHKDHQTQIHDASTFEVVYPDITKGDNADTITFPTAPASNAYRAVAVG